MTAKFDPVAFYEEAYTRIRKETGREDCHGETLHALAAEAAKRQAMRDAEICREQPPAEWAPEEACAQAIEKDAGLTEP